VKTATWNGLLQRQNRSEEKNTAADTKVDGEDATAELEKVEKAVLDNSVSSKCN